MFKIICKTESKTDTVTKYIVEDNVFGKNEISVLRKDKKDVVVLPTQTNCKMGCAFCHLTGTTRKAHNLTWFWLSEAVQFIRDLEQLGSKTILISFMGAGEPLINITNVLRGIEEISKRGSNIRFAISTMMPNTSALDQITKWCLANRNISLKLHLSVHGIESRNRIVTSHVSIEESITNLQRHSEITGLPIEYHYTLVNGVNDSVSELTKFRDLVVQSTELSTVKFLELSEVGECQKSEVSKTWLTELFSGMIVEFYDPPGRDVGSSCGMFDKSIYSEE
jgi:23S rRNA (adenine2503-C2)-methyltransferase